jgi:hypothetical protein
MLKHFHLGRRSSFPFVFLALVFVGFAYVVWQSQYCQSTTQPKNSIEILIGIVGAAAAFVHFLYSQHYQDTQTFVNLFEKFNTRYDSLNERLNAILSRPKDSPLTFEHVNTLYDYFNLCAEEYLFYESGYVDERVWRAWLLGMKYFAVDAAIRRLWEKEISSGSYYHFSLCLLDALEWPVSTGCASVE